MIITTGCAALNDTVLAMQAAANAAVFAPRGTQAHLLLLLFLMDKVWWGMHIEYRLHARVIMCVLFM